MITLGGDAELELVDSLDPFSEVTQHGCSSPKASSCIHHEARDEDPWACVEAGPGDSIASGSFSLASSSDTYLCLPLSEGNGLLPEQAIDLYALCMKGVRTIFASREFLQAAWTAERNFGAGHHMPLIEGWS